MPTGVDKDFCLLVVSRIAFLKDRILQTVAQPGFRNMGGGANQYFRVKLKKKSTRIKIFNELILVQSHTPYLPVPTSEKISTVLHKSHYWSKPQ